MLRSESLSIPSGDFSRGSRSALGCRRAAPPPRPRVREATGNARPLPRRASGVRDAQGRAGRSPARVRRTEAKRSPQQPDPSRRREAERRRRTEERHPRGAPPEDPNPHQSARVRGRPLAGPPERRLGRVSRPRGVPPQGTSQAPSSPSWPGSMKCSRRPEAPRSQRFGAWCWSATGSDQYQFAYPRRLPSRACAVAGVALAAGLKEGPLGTVPLKLPQPRTTLPAGIPSWARWPSTWSWLERQAVRTRAARIRKRDPAGRVCRDAEG